MASTSSEDVADKDLELSRTPIDESGDKSRRGSPTNDPLEPPGPQNMEGHTARQRYRDDEGHEDNTDDDVDHSENDEENADASNTVLAIDNDKPSSTRTASSDDSSMETDDARHDQVERLRRNSRATASSASAGAPGSTMQSKSSSDRHSAVKGAMQNHASSKRKLPLHARYRDAYRELLNEEIQQATTESYQGIDGRDDIEPTTLGASYWTSPQKQALFRAIALKGRDNIPYISQVTGKSQPEVLNFVSLLEQGVEQSLANPRKDSKYDFAQIPAAVEVSSEIEQSLDTAADTLARLQYSHEVQMEKIRHEGDWLIDQEYLDRMMHEDAGYTDDEFDTAAQGDHAEVEGDKADQHIDLINAAKLLELSRSLFMHSADPERDWQTYDANGPAIFRTAYEDLQQLAISIIRRIVYTAVFQYSSRCHGARSSAQSIEEARGISKQDVLAAVHVLSLKSDNLDYWAKLPSRLGLTCYYQPRTRKSEKQGFKGKAYKVSLRDAEAWLRGETPRALNIAEVETLSRIMDETSAAAISDSSDDSERDESGGDADADVSAIAENDPSNVIGEADLDVNDQTSEDLRVNLNDVSTETDVEEDADGRESSTSRINEVSREQRRETQDIELAAEITDAAASSTEEIRLWNLLGLKPPSHLRAASRETIHLENKARRHDVAEQHSDNWRQRTCFTSQWIRDQTIPAKQKFADMSDRRAKRKLHGGSDDDEIPFWAKKQRTEVDDMPDRLQLETAPSPSRPSDSDVTDTASTDSDEEIDVDEEQDRSQQGSVASRRSSTRRRASQVALQNIQESLEARSDLRRYMDSDDEFSPAR